MDVNQDVAQDVTRGSCGTAAQRGQDCLPPLNRLRWVARTKQLAIGSEQRRKFIPASTIGEKRGTVHESLAGSRDGISIK
jgi:hypothetical protein